MYGKEKLDKVDVVVVAYLSLVDTRIFTDSDMELNIVDIIDHSIIRVETISLDTGEAERTFDIQWLGPQSIKCDIHNINEICNIVKITCINPDEHDVKEGYLQAIPVLALGMLLH